MISEELSEEIDRLSSSIKSVHKINQSKAKIIIDHVFSEYIKDRSKIWWWESLKREFILIDYKDELGWDYISNLVDRNEMAYFIVTDDEPEPWPVYKGSVKDIIFLLREMWRFEYIVVSENISWIIFDTHHNNLILSGSLAQCGRLDQTECGPIR